MVTIMNYAGASCHRCLIHRRRFPLRRGGEGGDEGEGTLGAFLRNPPLALSVVEDIVDEEHRRRDSIVLCFYTWPGDGEITSES